MKLRYLGFCGIDESINIPDLLKISKIFPFVEWGILLRSDLEGTSRYPTADWITHFLQKRSNCNYTVNLAGHLCGNRVTELFSGNYQYIEYLNSHQFNRLQVNATKINGVTLNENNLSMYYLNLITAIRAFPKIEWIIQRNTETERLCQLIESNAINHNNIRVSMNSPEYRSKEIEIDGIRGFYIFVGAKHFVINYKDEWPSIKILENIAKKIRYNKIFENGINVNFYKNDKDNIDVITYEKGIEKIMSSCASGSFACAYHHIFNNNLKNKDIYITNIVGELFAYIDLVKGEFFMSGPAEIEYEKELKFELGNKL